MKKGRTMRNKSETALPKCPLQQCAQQASQSGRNFRRDLRKLRRMQEHCKLCALEPECAIRLEFDELVDQVVSDINQEWGWS
jgi:hypothetical protein